MTKLMTDFFTLISDPINLQILQYLKGKKRSSKEIKKRLTISQSYTSQKLKKLIKQELIDYQRNDNGLKIYSVKYKKVYDILNMTKQFIKNIQANKYERIFKKKLT